MLRVVRPNLELKGTSNLPEARFADSAANSAGLAHGLLKSQHLTKHPKDLNLTVDSPPLNSKPKSSQSTPKPLKNSRPGPPP